MAHERTAPKNVDETGASKLISFPMGKCNHKNDKRGALLKSEAHCLQIYFGDCSKKNS